MFDGILQLIKKVETAINNLDFVCKFFLRMAQDATQTQIDNYMASSFAQMNEYDKTLIEISLPKAKLFRNLIWTKLKSAMAAGRTTTQMSATMSIGKFLSFCFQRTPDCCFNHFSLKAVGFLSKRHSASLLCWFPVHLLVQSLSKAPITSTGVGE